ncbi:MAG: S9 family peptidase [Candidatus Dormibacteraeota bacterium]|nr:S9 family peptidase [Candidatus Dormibacteraeota bacterium]
MATIPYGAWPSPLGAAEVAAGSVRLADLIADGNDAYWIEGRPAEQGRCVVVRRRGDRIEDVLPPNHSARTWVHEYGGGAFAVSNGRVCFSNAGDGRLYRIEDGRATPLTQASDGLRFADMVFDPARERLLAVTEDHRGSAVVNQLGSVSLRNGEVIRFASGHDFYSSPRFSPDGSRVAWLCWDNPNMPWDGCELWVAGLDGEGAAIDPLLVAGGIDESIFQPEWSPDGVLHYVSDRSGWWNLYRDAAGGGENLLPIDADCGVPAWVFRLTTYAFLADGSVAVGGAREGVWELWIVDAAGRKRKLEVPFTDIDGAVVASGPELLLLAGGPALPTSVVSVDPQSGQSEVLRRSSEVAVPDEVLSVAQPITFPGQGGATAYAYYYPPRNHRVDAPQGELPPLLVRAHGGPTSATTPALSASVQFWTSRGFAFVDVDYGGSVGYGREYRRRLNGQQGIVDVGDCVAAAQHLARTGAADPERLLIEGGSAGGYIVLCAMTFHNVFAAGASLFGISDLELLVADTHKFEARYFDHMVGPYPEEQRRYHDRSPIHFIDQVRKPLLLLQGLDDPIVPPNQAETMVVALREAGRVVAYVGFAGEQHGFRQAANIQRSAEAQLLFFRRVLGIEAEEQLPPLDIANLS